MNRSELVGGSDEQDPREVYVDLEIMIAERMVLRRIEDLEQRRGRIPLYADRDLVDFVEHQHRIR